MGYLIRQPAWLLGISTGAVAFCLHAVALNLGAIALVQPIMICGIVFAVVIRAALDRSAPTRVEITAVSTTAVGLALFLVMSDPQTGGAGPERDRALAMVLVSWCVVLAIFLTRERRPARLSAALLGVAAGVIFGLTAGLVKLITVDLGTNAVGLPTLLAVLALGASGLSGISINQEAYRLAPLSTSMPVLNVISVCVAVLFGVLVFAEYPAFDFWASTGQAVGLLLMGAGLWIIARHTQGAVPPVGAERE